MLTAKQNFLETVRGGKPDRFVNQYEAIQLLFHPYLMRNPMPAPGAAPIKNAWGVTVSWPAGHPGAFPIHTENTIVVKGIEAWRDYVKAPSVRFSDEDWARSKAMFDAVDSEKAFKAAFVAPGLLSTCIICAPSAKL